jgi:thymidylate synthase ThyX
MLKSFGPVLRATMSLAENTDRFTAAEQAQLAPFVTNLERPIFALRHLPEVVKGALFSRYSRSEKSLRRILLDEFITAPEAHWNDWALGAADPGGVALAKAEAFYDRVLIGYGDDSVAELGGAHLACEAISNLAAKALEDSRLGLSPLEKSSRYVAFNQRVNGQYLYYREPTIMASAHGDLYVHSLDRLFDTYTALYDPLIAWVRHINPQDAHTSDRAYGSATRAKTFDLLRGLLPMATLTNVGLFGNGRAFEYLLVKLAASPHLEVQQLGSAMQQELDQTIPSFVKRAKSDRGRQYSQYLATNYQRTHTLSQGILTPDRGGPQSAQVTLVEWDPEAETKVVAAILYPHGSQSFAAVQERAAQLSTEERQQIITTYAGDRASRFHRPGRAFEETYYTFDILADLGAYRDLHRHRVLTQERQTFTVGHGYTIPPEVEAAGLATSYGAALDRTATAFDGVAADLPLAAQYLVPFAYHTRWRIRLNLREAYHFIELRSSRQGHTGYRQVAQEMYHQIATVHPTLARSMTFVDLDAYELERLGAEQKLDLQRQVLG